MIGFIIIGFVAGVIVGGSIGFYMAIYDVREYQKEIDEIGGL